MSLRAFHLIFISIVTFFFLGVATWSLFLERGSQDTVLSVLGYSCAVAAVLLPIYGVRFYQKICRSL